MGDVHTLCLFLRPRGQCAGPAGGFQSYHGVEKAMAENARGHPRGATERWDEQVENELGRDDRGMSRNSM